MNNFKMLRSIIGLLALGLGVRSANASLVTFAITGTGVHGSTASGTFTIEDGNNSTYYTPGYSASGGIYQSASLTISNISGPGPSTVTFSGLDEVGGSTFLVASNGVTYIAPAAWHDYGPPNQDYYRVDSSQPYYPTSLIYESTLIYDNWRPEAASDLISWSAATIVPTPEPGTWALLLSGLLLLGMVALRRRRAFSPW